MTPILGTIASQISGHLVAPDLGSFFPIRSYVVPATAQSSITFSSIPATYTHLQVRGIMLNGSAVDNWMQFNSDTGSNYSYHQLVGSGTAASSSSVASASKIPFGYIDGTSSQPSSFVCDILDYANTNKYKTSRMLWGYETNAATYADIRIISGNWRNTNAITSITIYPNSGNFNTYSSFALYGVMA